MPLPRVLMILWTVGLATLAAQDAGRPAEAPPRFESAPCPFTGDAKVMEQVRCGHVTVAENRAAPGGRRLKLAVAIVKSLNPTPRPDPVVFVAGGPGGRTVSRVPAIVTGGTLDAIRQDRDMIFYDQRGTGLSEPRFCPEVSARLASSAPGGPAARRAAQRELLASCGEYMRSAGVDLAQYNSIVSAHDLQDLRRAMGYEQWNLRAVSYGTRLALTALRVAPRGIRSVVLDGPSPPNRAAWFNKPADFADLVQRLSAACAAQPACNTAFPDVEKTFWRTVTDWEREPITASITLPNGSAATIRADGAVLAAAISGALEGGQRRLVPLAIHAAAARNETVMMQFARLLATRQDASGNNINWGLHYTLHCFEEAPLNTNELKERMRSAHGAVLTDRGVFPDPSNCDGVHGFRATADDTALVRSEVPALIFTGEFDFNTHRSNGALVAVALEHSQLVEIPGGGHGESARYECTRTMTRDFFNEPRRTVDRSCLKTIPPLRFVTDVKML